MTPTIQRLQDMAAGFGGGAGIVTINLADAAILGMKPKKPGDQTVEITADALCAKCAKLSEPAPTAPIIVPIIAEVKPKK